MLVTRGFGSIDISNMPSESDVKDGVAYGSGDVTFEGTLNWPVEEVISVDILEDIISIDIIEENIEIDIED